MLLRRVMIGKREKKQQASILDVRLAVWIVASEGDHEVASAADVEVIAAVHSHLECILAIIEGDLLQRKKNFKDQYIEKYILEYENAMSICEIFRIFAGFRCI